MLKPALVALSLAFVAAPAALTEAPEVSAQAPNAAEIITAKVNGMVCDFCAQAVTAMFGKDAAVEHVDVDLDQGEIRVTLKPGSTLSDARVEELVTKSGYDLVEVLRAAA